MTSPWLVPVTSLRRNPGARQAEQREGRLGQLSVAGSAVAPDATVTLEIVLSSISGGIEVAGTVLAPWRGECRRCLRPVGGELASSVRELYRPRRGGDEPDEETYELGSETLDLAPLARDAILLELPLAPLCRPDCAGLCPSCGADLNEGACGCDLDDRDPRWSALDALRPGSGPAR